MANSASRAPTKGLWKVIDAASAGTLIEWYDFYLFGNLATVISTHFFPAGHPTVAFLSTLEAFGTGFIVRPFGAPVFGHCGDVVGRTHTFLLTLLLMGSSIFAIGLLPTYETAHVCLQLPARHRRHAEPHHPDKIFATREEKK